MYSVSVDFFLLELTYWVTETQNLTNSLRFSIWDRQAAKKSAMKMCVMLVTHRITRFYSNEQWGIALVTVGFPFKRMLK